MVVFVVKNFPYLSSLFIKKIIKFSVPDGYISRTFQGLFKLVSTPAHIFTRFDSLHSTNGSRVVCVSEMGEVVTLGNSGFLFLISGRDVSIEPKAWCCESTPRHVLQRK